MAPAALLVSCPAALEIKMQEELDRLYKQYLRREGPKALRDQVGKRCSAPLLISALAAPSWAVSKNRILVVGQETLGWGLSDDLRSLNNFFSAGSAGLQSIQADYRTFLRDDISQLSSPFWQVFKRLAAAPNTSVLWSNLFRCAAAASSPDKPSYGSNYANLCWGEWAHVIDSHHGLLRDEIAILAPTAVLFLTGPRYDSALVSALSEEPIRDTEILRAISAGNPTFNSVLRPVLDADVSALKLMQVSHQTLQMPSFRTYHPRFLWMSEQRKQQFWSFVNTKILM